MKKIKCLLVCHFPFVVGRRDGKRVSWRRVNFNSLFPFPSEIFQNPFQVKQISSKARMRDPTTGGPNTGNINQLKGIVVTPFQAVKFVAFGRAAAWNSNGKSFLRNPEKVEEKRNFRILGEGDGGGKSCSWERLQPGRRRNEQQKPEDRMAKREKKRIFLGFERAHPSPFPYSNLEKGTFLSINFRFHIFLVVPSEFGVRPSLKNGKTG